MFDTPQIVRDQETEKESWNLVLLVFCICGLALMLYQMGKVDGREDALKQCSTEVVAGP